MKYYKVIFLLFLFFISYSIDSYSQYYTEAQIINIDTNKLAIESDLYLDTIKNKFFIGLSSGRVSEIGMDSAQVAAIMDDLLDSLNFTYFPIWAERSSALANNSFQWAYGNGDASNNGFGILIPVKCELFAVGLTCRTGSAEVEVYKNTSATGLRSGTASPNALNTSITPLAFNSGDIVNFQTVTAAGADDGGKAVAWFRVLGKITPAIRLYGGSVPSASIGKDFDEFLNTSTGNLYSKDNGAWVLQTNLKGITGASSIRSYIQVTNTVTTDLNNDTTTFNWIDTLLTTHVTNDASNFNVDTNGITVNKTATYKVTIYQFQTTTDERQNAAIKLTINGITQNGFGANAYMRDLSGHSESTASFSKIISVSLGQKIGFVNVQMGNGGDVIGPANGLVFMIEEM